MQHSNFLLGRFLCGSAVALASLLGSAVQAAAPGITGTGAAGTFNLTASASYITQPDGASIYSWGYGCTSSFTPSFSPATDKIGGASCDGMQIPGPTLIVWQGTTVTVALTNSLPTAAGNTSILFPGFKVTATGGSVGVLAREAPPCPSTGCTAANTVTYTFVADTAGTHAYYSGTQSDLQIEMGLYGALIVLPTNAGNTHLTATLPDNYTTQASAADTCYTTDHSIANKHGDQDFRLAAAAYNNPQACYDREYLFQMSEIEPRIHSQA